MEESNAPYSNLKDNGALEGLWVDIANEMIKDTDLQVRWRAAPWKRLFVTVKQTPNSVVFGILHNPEREGTFIFIGPITERRIHLFKLQERSNIKIGVLDEAKPYTVGGFIGAYHTEFLNAHGIETSDIESSMQNIKMLVSTADRVMWITIETTRLPLITITFYLSHADNQRCHETET